MYTIEDLEDLVCELAHKKVKHDYDLIQARPHFSGEDSRYVMYKNYKTREYTDKHKIALKLNVQDIDGY